MAGTSVMYNAMSGLPSMMRALADDSMRAKGYATQAGAMHAQAQTRKLEDDLTERGTQRAGKLGWVAGQHGVDPTAVSQMMQTLAAGGKPDLTPFGEKGNAVLRDYGGITSGEFPHIAGYNTGQAELPQKNMITEGMRTGLDAVKANTNLSGADLLNHLNAATRGHMVPNEPSDPTGQRMFEWFNKLPENEKAAYIRMQQAVKGPGTSINNYAGPQWVATPDGNQMVVPTKDGSRYTTVPLPPGSGPVRPPMSAKERLMERALSGVAGGAPAAQPAAQPAAPTGAKPVVSQDGKWRLKPGANPDLKSSWEPNR